MLAARTWHASDFCGIDLRHAMYLYILSLILDVLQTVQLKPANVLEDGEGFN